MKVSSGSVLDILRSFGQATRHDVPRQVEYLEIGHPSSINLAAKFRFHKRQYVMLFDDTAEDDTAYLMNEVQVLAPNTSGFFIKSQISDVETYGMPYEGKDVYLFVEDRGDKRLDAWLVENYPDFSRSSWQKYIKNGHVLVNGAVVISPSAAITTTDSVTVDLPEKTDHTRSELPILYIDDDVIVIDKPVGILTHAKNPLDDEFTVAKFFARYSTVGLDSDRPGIVHRLDRDTSGVMVGARTPAAYEHLKIQFSNRTVHKQYVAVTDGVLSQAKARIDIPIARNASRPGSFMSHQSGKPAVTDLEVTRSNTLHSYVLLTPHTGRTHQLRVHMAHLGAPIYGDRLYGSAADRLYLHAHKLSLLLPNGGQKEFTSQVPVEFDAIMESVNE